MRMAVCVRRHAYGACRYVNERIVGTQYTAWHWVAQLRQGLPKPMGALQWWGARGRSHAGAQAPPPPSRMRMRIHTSPPSAAACIHRWGADDHTWAPKIPLHGGASALHHSYDDANCTARAACRRANHLPGNVRELPIDAARWIAWMASTAS